MSSTSKVVALTILLLMSLDSHGATLNCGSAFKEIDIWARIQNEIRPVEEPINFFDKTSYLREYKRASSIGNMQSRFDRKLETRFYYSGTGVPDSHTGRQPLVDPNAKAVFIMVHGSGTMNSSGRNFAGLMNTLGQAGYSGVAFDLPFHAEGPRKQTLNDSRDFMRWFDQVVNQIKSEAGEKPIYLVGHSFGPDVILEYLLQNPRAADGAALLSPAGFDPVLERWYEQHTSEMKFGGDVAENTLGGEWAGKIAEQLQWHRTQGRLDPSVRNRSLRIRMLSGDREEYVPAPLNAKGLPAGRNTYDMEAAFRRHVRNAEITIEPGVGHYVFDHVDPQGRNIVVREVLALDEVDARNLGQIINARSTSLRLSLVDRLSIQYSTDRLFKSWVDSIYTARAFRAAIRQENELMLKDLEKEYAAAKFQQEEAIRRDILELAERDADFYQRYKTTIDQMRSGQSRGNTTLFATYLEYVNR